MSNEQILLAKLTAVEQTLNELQRQFEAAMLSETFFFRQFKALKEKNNQLLIELKPHLESKGAGSVSHVLTLALDGADEQEITKAVEVAQVESKEKGWGDAWIDALKDHQGKIADTAVMGVIKLARVIMT